MSHNAKAWKLKCAPFNTKRPRTLSSLKVVKRQAVPKGVVYLIKLIPRNKWYFFKCVCVTRIPRMHYIHLSSQHANIICTHRRQTNAKNKKITAGNVLCLSKNVIKVLRAILRESEAKLEMKKINPPQFLCGGRLPGGINKNNHIWIGRCIVAMVTTLDRVGQKSMF